MRIYTYYSVGGYKTLMMGDSATPSKFTYYFPLLEIYREKGDPRVAKCDALPQWELVTNTDLHDLPSECTRYFSRGGYEAAYFETRSEEACFVIRSLSNGSRDEEGREIPFSLAFAAKSSKDVDELDSFVEKYIEHRGEISVALGNLIKHDSKLNGLQFAFEECMNLMRSADYNARFNHRGPRVMMVMTGSQQMLEVFKTEVVDAHTPIDHVLLPGETLEAPFAPKVPPMPPEVVDKPEAEPKRKAEPKPDPEPEPTPDPESESDPEPEPEPAHEEPSQKGKSAFDLVKGLMGKGEIIGEIKKVIADILSQNTLKITNAEQGKYDEIISKLNDLASRVNGLESILSQLNHRTSASAGATTKPSSEAAQYQFKIDGKNSLWILAVSLLAGLGLGALIF